MRLKEYTETQPHKGFEILKKWIEKFGLDYFVITSNILGSAQGLWKHWKKLMPGFSDKKALPLKIDSV